MMRTWALAALIGVGATACGEPKSDDDDEQTETTETEDSATEPDAVWSEHRVETPSTFTGVYASGGGVYVAGSGGEIWVGGSDDDWARIEVDLEENDIGGLWGSGVGESVELVAVASTGIIGHLAGGTWTSTDTGTANHEGVHGSASNRIYAVSWGGIYLYDGNSWTYEPVPADARLNAVYAVGEQAMAVGEDGVALMRDAGVWTEVDTGYNGDLRGVHGVTMDDVWAVGETGTALHWDGASWTPGDTGITYDISACFAASSNVVYAVGNNGVALRWDGSVWTDLPTGVTNNLYAIHGVSGSNVWAVGNKGMALQFKDD